MLRNTTIEKRSWISRLGLGGLVAALLLGPISLVEAQVKPVVVASLASYNELIKDIEFVGKLTDNPDLAKSVEGFIGFFTQFQGLAGLDKDKPLGLMIGTDGVGFQVLGFLPATNLDALLGALKGVLGEVDDAGDGIKQIKVQLATVYLKQNKGWAFVAIDKEALSGDLPSDPQKMLNGLDVAYDLGVRAFIQNVPQAYRDFAIQQIQMGAQQNLRRQGDESDEDFALRKQLADQSLEEVRKLINDLNEVTVGLAIDSTEKVAFYEVGFSGVQGSNLAKQFQGLTATPSKLTGFLADDGLIRVHANLTSDQKSVEQTLAFLNAGRQKTLAKIDEDRKLNRNPEHKALVQEAASTLFDVLADTLQAGHMNVGAIVVGEGPFDVAAGAQLVGADRLEKVFLKLANAAKSLNEVVDKGITFELNAEKHEGVSFHHITFPIPEDKPEADEVKKFLGEEIVLTFAFGKNQMFVGLGETADETIVDVIDDSKAGDASAPPVEVSVALETILKKIKEAQPDEPALAVFADAVKSPHDHVHLFVELTESGLIERIEIEQSLIRALGLLVKFGAAQRQGR